MKGVSPSFLQKPEGVTWGDPWCSRVKGLHMFLFWPDSETKPELFLVLFLAIFERLPKMHFWKIYITFSRKQKKSSLVIFSPFGFPVISFFSETCRLCNEVPFHENSSFWVKRDLNP